MRNSNFNKSINIVIELGSEYELSDLDDNGSGNELEISKNGTLDASQNVPVVDSDPNFSGNSSDDESIDMSFEKPSCSKTEKKEACLSMATSGTTCL